MECTESFYLNQQQCQANCFGEFKCEPKDGIYACCLASSGDKESSEFNIWLFVISLCTALVLSVFVVLGIWVVVSRRKATELHRVEPLRLEIDDIEQHVPNSSGTLGSP